MRIINIFSLIYKWKQIIILKNIEYMSKIEKYCQNVVESLQKQQLSVKNDKFCV